MAVLPPLDQLGPLTGAATGRIPAAAGGAGAALAAWV